MPNVDRIYLDYNATAPLLSCARDAVIEALSHTGNASSVHFEGRGARKSLEAARRSIAGLIDADPANVILTSGATEAANHALSPVLRAGGSDLAVSTLLVGETEHPCILASGRFPAQAVEPLPVDESGVLDQGYLVEKLQEASDRPGLTMVAVQLANNETGVVQPIAEIAQKVHEHEAVLLVDAVQALGKMPLKLADLGADFLLLSSHKIGGPQGAGALVLANGNLSPVPLLSGGGQEQYHRGGTENVAAIAGFGAACDWHRENLTKNIRKYQIRDSIEQGLRTISHQGNKDAAHPVIFGQKAPRLGNTTCFALPGIRAETALVAFDLEGIALSSGSACSSGKVKQSHVLRAMGASETEMAGAVRLSLGWETRQEDANHFLGVWEKIIGRMAA